MTEKSIIEQQKEKLINLSQKTKNKFTIFCIDYLLDLIEDYEDSKNPLRALVDDTNCQNGSYLTEQRDIDSVINLYFEEIINICKENDYKFQNKIPHKSSIAWFAFDNHVAEIFRDIYDYEYNDLTQGVI